MEVDSFRYLLFELGLRHLLPWSNHAGRCKRGLADQSAARAQILSMASDSGQMLDFGAATTTWALGL
jgi:hypothetical protein